MYENVGYRPTETKKKARARNDSSESNEASTDAASDRPLVVQARGSNFNWYFSYAGSDGLLSEDGRSLIICVIPVPDSWLKRTYGEVTIHSIVATTSRIGP